MKIPKEKTSENQYVAGAGPYDLVIDQAAAHAAVHNGAPHDMLVFVEHVINEYTRLLRDQHRDACPFTANMLDGYTSRPH